MPVIAMFSILSFKFSQNKYNRKSSMVKFPEFFCLLMALCLPEVESHLCLISPRQRGEMNFSKGGSPTCFRHGPECGGQAPELPPPTELVAGQPLFIKWQQNYNHYDIGYPGYMDIAIAVANEMDKTDADPFTILATVADVDQYDQAHQQNYTAVVTLPNMGCDHCVIRARYVSHKPGESIFYQCADVKLTEPTESASLRHNFGDKVQLLLEHGPNLPEHGHGLGDGDVGFDSESVKVKQNNPLPSKDWESRIELPIIETDEESSLINPTPRKPVQNFKFQEHNREHSLDKIDNEQPLRKALHFLHEHPSRKRHTLSQATGTPTDSLKLYGMVNSIDSTNSSLYLSIDALTGERMELNRLPFGVDSPVGQYVTDGVITFDTARGLTLMSYHGHGDMDALPNSVVELNSNSGTVQTIYNITARNKNVTLPTTAFSCVVVEIEDTYVTFNLEPDSRKSGFYFVVGRLYRDGSWEQLSKTNRLEDTYINFLWADFDISVKTLYVLLGNENDPYGLSARLYQFFVPPGSPLPEPIDFYSSVEVNMTQFPFMAFYLSNWRTDTLYAISPGTWNHTYPSYHLVALNVDNGSVTDIGQLTPPGIFERFYGGSVFNGFNSLSNQLLHVLRVADTQTDVIMHVNVLTKDVRFSELTNLRNVKNLACPWNVD